MPRTAVKRQRDTADDAVISMGDGKSSDVNGSDSDSGLEAIKPAKRVNKQPPQQPASTVTVTTSTVKSGKAATIKGKQRAIDQSAPDPQGLSTSLPENAVMDRIAQASLRAENTRLKAELKAVSRGRAFIRQEQWADCI